MPEIESNIPIPTRGTPRLRARRYPELFALRRGDSILIEGKLSFEVTPYVSYAVREARDTEGIVKKFKTQITRDKRGDLLGTRIWRVK